MLPYISNLLSNLPANFVSESCITDEFNGEVEHDAVRVFIRQWVEQIPPRRVAYHLP